MVGLGCHQGVVGEGVVCLETDDEERIDEGWRDGRMDEPRLRWCERAGDTLGDGDW